MDFDQIKKEVSRLELTEQLTLVEDIWDAIAARNSDIPFPVWQQQVLAQRLKDFEAGKSATTDAQTVHEELRRKYQ